MEEDMEAAKGCWRHLLTMFQELEECRAFELLKVQIHPSVALLLQLLSQGVEESRAIGLLSVGPKCGSKMSVQNSDQGSCMHRATTIG